MKMIYAKGAKDSFEDASENKIDYDIHPPLLTKFIVPKPQNDSFVRNELINRLNFALDKKIIIICAPAGYGKTSLLADWLSAKDNKVSVAWISIDSNDNDISRFWINILYSVMGTGFLSEDEMHIILNDIRHLQIEKALVQLINKALNSLKQITIVIDNYHHISHSSVLNSLSYFIEHIPDNIHFIFTGRVQFPLPIAKMQLSNQVLQIGMGELRLSQEELFIYLGRFLESEVSPELLKEFEVVTEGWIAAVKSIAVRMKTEAAEDLTNRRPEELIHNIYPYIKEEIASHLPVQIHDFLSKTSFLHTLQESMCNKIIGISNSAEILKFLECSNLFIFLLDSEKSSFRYHYIFCRYWRYELETKMNQDNKEWCMNMVKMLEKEEYIESALNMAMYAKSFELLGELLVKYIEYVFLDLGAWKTLVYFKSIPEGILKGNPILCIYYVISLMITKRIFDGQAYMSQIGLPLSEPVFDKHMIHKTLIFAQSAIIRRDFVTASQYWNMLNEAACGTVICCALDVYVSRFFLVSGYGHKAEVILEKVMEYAKATQNAEYLCVVTWDYAITKMYRGEINSSFSMASNLIKKLLPGKSPQNEIYQLPKLGLSLLCYEINDIERAAAYFPKNTHILDDEMEQITVGIRPFVLSRIFLAKNNRIKALKVLHENDYIYLFDDTLLNTSRFIHDIARVCIILEEKEWIRKIKQYIAGCTNNYGETFVTESIAFADILIYEGDALKALKILCELTDNSVCAVKLLDMKINILKALAYHCLGKSTEALEFIRYAVLISGQHGFIRSFIDYGEAVKELLLELQNTKQKAGLSDEDGYVLKLLSHFRIGMEVASQEGKLLNTLNSREAEVLRYICLGCSSKTIADFCYVSVSLVKKIKTSIFRKLGVANRAEAIIFVKKMNPGKYWDITPDTDE
jgi:LuxR family transcriptional regulator, maltose regulon positive regulatory protein